METWTEEKIVALLHKDSRAVMRALVAIYDRQTRDEKSASTTRHSNQIGFSAADAPKGSYYARWVLSGRVLTGFHFQNARRLAIKYRKQLLQIAQEKAKGVK